MDRLFFGIGSIVGLLTVAAGAFGAHALQSRIDARAMEIFQTAVRYQMMHALALIAAAWAATRFTSGAARFGGWAFVVGVVVFCGTLYGLALGGPRFLGAITPIGGAAFMIGWGCLAWSALAA